MACAFQTGLDQLLIDQIVVQTGYGKGLALSRQFILGIETDAQSLAYKPFLRMGKEAEQINNSDAAVAVIGQRT